MKRAKVCCMKSATKLKPPASSPELKIELPVLIETKKQNQFI
jgi:hypothetical protein